MFCSDLNSNKFSSGFIYSIACRLQRIIIRNTKFSVTTMNTYSEPHLIFFDQREHLFIGDGILISYRRYSYGKLQKQKQVF